MLKLTTTITITSKYTGKSKYDFWKELDVGHKVLISHEIGTCGSKGFGNGYYAPDINLKNLETGSEIKSSYGDFINYLGKVGFEEKC